MERKIIDSKKYYVIAISMCAFGIVALLVYYFFTGFSRESETQYVYVDADDTADSVVTKLRPMASRHAMTALSTLLRHAGYADNIRTGRYAIAPDDGVITVFRHLKNGQQTPMRLTLPESRTMDRLAGQLSRKLMADSLELIKTFTDTALLAELGYDTATVAAMMVPNTYEVYWNITGEQLMQRLKREHDSFWNYDRQHRAEVLGLTPVEVATLASIIDEETANTAEKPMIARMYMNRLKANMPLQADPTVKFALKQFELKRIYHGMLDFDSPYNTYANTGLPPGPIKIASIKGIDAVLSPADHDYLYMCAKEDFSGTHNFARNYQEHLRNAAKYSKALNERGIK